MSDSTSDCFLTQQLQYVLGQLSSPYFDGKEGFTQHDDFFIEVQHRFPLIKTKILGIPK